MVSLRNCSDFQWKSRETRRSDTGWPEYNPDCKEIDISRNLIEIVSKSSYILRNRLSIVILGKLSNFTLPLKLNGKSCSINRERKC